MDIRSECSISADPKSDRNIKSLFTLVRFEPNSHRTQKCKSTFFMEIHFGAQDKKRHFFWKLSFVLLMFPLICVKNSVLRLASVRCAMGSRTQRIKKKPVFQHAFLGIRKWSQCVA